MLWNRKQLCAIYGDKAIPHSVQRGFPAGDKPSNKMKALMKSWGFEED